MSEEKAKTIDERRKELEAVFAELEAKETKLREDGAELNRQLSAIREDKLRLQGAHAVLMENFDGAPKLEKPKETTVKKRTNTKK